MDYELSQKKIHFNVGDHQTYWMVHLGIDVMGHPRVKQGTHYLWWFPDAYLLTCHESIRRNCALHFVVFFFGFTRASSIRSLFSFHKCPSLAVPIYVQRRLKNKKKRPSRLINTVIFYAYMQVSSHSSTVSNKKKKKSRDRRYTSNKQCCSRWGSFEFKPCLDAAGETSKRRSLRSFIALVAGSTFFFFLIFFKFFFGFSRRKIKWVTWNAWLWLCSVWKHPMGSAASTRRQAQLTTTGKYGTLVVTRVNVLWKIANLP